MIETETTGGERERGIMAGDQGTTSSGILVSIMTTMIAIDPEIEMAVGAVVEIQMNVMAARPEMAPGHRQLAVAVGPTHLVSKEEVPRGGMSGTLTVVGNWINRAG